MRGEKLPVPHRGAKRKSGARRRVERPARRHRPPEHRVPTPPWWGRLGPCSLSWRVLPRATSWLHRSDRPQVEPLVERVLPAVTATFLPGAGTLSIFGDALDNTIPVSRDAAGQILVNGGAVNVVGGTPTVANVSLIQVFGQAGNDTVTLDEANGALPKANLFGGTGGVGQGGGLFASAVSLSLHSDVFSSDTATGGAGGAGGTVFGTGGAGGAGQGGGVFASAGHYAQPHRRPLRFRHGDRRRRRHGGARRLRLQQQRRRCRWRCGPGRRPLCQRPSHAHDH